MLGAAQQFEQLGRARVADLDELGGERGELGELPAALEFQPFALGDFAGGRHQKDVADLALVESLRAQDQVECLVPGNPGQPQRQAAGHGAAGHQVASREVGEQLQGGTGLDVLEVESDRVLTSVLTPGPGRCGRRLRDRGVEQQGERRRDGRPWHAATHRPAAP